MSANVYIIEDYENETVFRPKKTNPTKANFQDAKMNLELIRKSGHTHLLDVLSFFRRTWSKKLLKWISFLKYTKAGQRIEL